MNKLLSGRSANPCSANNRVGSTTSQKGVSLVELLVAMTIGIFLLGAVGIVYVSTSRASNTGTLEAEMNEDASLALEILQQQIRLAGFSTIAADSKRNFTGIAVRGCDGDFNATDAAFDALACKTTGQHALAVRYEATILNSQTVQDATGADLPDNCSHSGITAWDASATGGTSSIALADNRYYIANDNGIPSLYCKGRTGTGFGDAVALIPNIEEMKIEYGITNSPVEGEPLPHQITAYVAASNDKLKDTAASWNRVAAVRICLLARSAKPVPQGGSSKENIGYYRDCSGDEKTGITDNYLRRAYVTTIQLRNMRPGVPAPYADNENPYQYLNDE